MKRILSTKKYDFVLIYFLILTFNLTTFTNCDDSFLEKTIKYNNDGKVPIIINTWAFDQANKAGWSILKENGSALDAIVASCSECESLQCDHTVGWGGSPDENGETTLDAMIMDGPSHKIGSVAGLRRVKNAIGVAYAILKHSTHTMLVGDQATDFAKKMNFPMTNLTSDWSQKRFDEWKSNKCQPNYWMNVKPDPKNSCGPYEPKDDQSLISRFNDENFYNVINDPEYFDTIGAIAIDHQGRIASGTSTNGMIHKIPGRVGDSPIPGSGSYCDQDIGGAAATGDGDIIMRFLPSYQAVENLRNGMTPTESGQEALRRVLIKYPKAQIGIVVVDINGNFGAACTNLNNTFPFMVSSFSLNDEKTIKHSVECIKPTNFSLNLKISNLFIFNMILFCLIFICSLSILSIT